MGWIEVTGYKFCLKKALVDLWQNLAVCAWLLLTCYVSTLLVCYCIVSFQPFGCISLNFILSYLSLCYFILSYQVIHIVASDSQSHLRNSDSTSNSKLLMVLCSFSAGSLKKGSSSNSTPSEQYFLRWDKADVNSYYYYRGQYLEPYLRQVDEAPKSSDTIPLETIDNLYNAIVFVLTSGAKLFVSTRRRNFYKFWWDQGLDALKDAAINSNRIWKAAGKPRQGSLFDKRQRCRAQYRDGKFLPTAV